MDYLISKMPCYAFNEKLIKIEQNVQYEIKDISKFLVVGEDGFCSFVFNKDNQSVLKVSHKSNNYYFLFPKCFSNGKVVSVRFQNNDYILSVSGELTILLDGNVLLDKVVDIITYSHYETFGKYCLIYFTGKRNFVVAIKDKKVCFAEYYDEYNFENNEHLFMCRLYDSLNHGRVFKISESKDESYLVYLDNQDMALKKDFVGAVFLDCLKAQNLKYANCLLSDEIKQENEKNIIEFFPNFDDFYFVNENEFFLLKKNTLAGIYSFEIADTKISNITSLFEINS